MMDPTAACEVMERLLTLGNWDRVVKEGLRFLESFPDDSYLLRAVGAGYLNLDEVQKAEVFLKAAIREDPEHPFGYYLLCRFYLEKKKYARAEKAVTMAIRLDPDDADYRVSLGYLMLRAGNAFDALQCAKDALAAGS